MKKILVVDDEEIIRISLEEGLKDLGYSVKSTKNIKESLELLKSYTPHVVFLDMKLSDEDGLDLLTEIKLFDNDIEVVIMTAYGDIDTAVKSIKLGAFDYINKPFDLEEIDIIIKRILDSDKLKQKIRILEESSKRENYKVKIIGNHKSMEDIYNKIDVLSNTDDVTVLIQGETGTGKDVVAAAIHETSQRRKLKMLKINCSSIPHQLMESEFFGYEKNAFTGAMSRKKGLMEIADGSTVFLDEIGEMPMEMQSKLLTFIEDKKFRRIGGTEAIEVNVRIIAATNKDLEKAVLDGEFREDLYYRLNVVPVYMPPLRERGEDVLLLAEHFLEEYSKKYQKSILGFTKEAKDKMLNYHWHGNVRELRNILERAVLLANTKYLDYSNLPIYDRKDLVANAIKLFEGYQFEEDFSLEDKVEEMEKKYIKLALESNNNNYTKAAEALGITRFSLKRRIEKYY